MLSNVAKKYFYTFKYHSLIYLKTPHHLIQVCFLRNSFSEDKWLYMEESDLKSASLHELTHYMPPTVPLICRLATVRVNLKKK